MRREGGIVREQMVREKSRERGEEIKRTGEGGERKRERREGERYRKREMGKRENHSKRERWRNRKS